MKLDHFEQYRINPIRELVAYGAVTIRIYVIFHNWMLREYILLTVGGVDNLRMSDTGKVLPNSQSGSGRAI